MTTPQQARSARRNEVRAELVAQWLRDSVDDPENFLGMPLCEIRWDRGCQGRAIEGHEPLMRSRGGDVHDRANVFLTCRYCHHRVHDNVKLATERGFLVSRYAKG